MASSRRERGRGAGAGEREGGVTTAVKASSALGLVGAMALAVVANVAVARNYRRWDWTSARLYTLSDATRETLRGLGEPVQIFVLLSTSDPLAVSVRHLLSAYTAETDRLDVRYVDPDRKPAEFLQLQKQFGLVAGRTEDGRTVTDAAVVVVRGDRRWFLTPADLVDTSEADEGRARPKLEQGLTLGLRKVLGGEKTRVCFSKGHGELGADEPGARGLSELKYRLERNNVDVAVVDATAPDAKGEPWAGCTLAVIAGPQTPFAEREAKALGKYFEGGGALLIFANPMLDAEKKRQIASGLEPVLALGGVKARGDLALERDAAFRVDQGMGETFFAQPKAHPITQALVAGKAPNARILVVLGQSFERAPQSPVQPAELLTTSKEAFGMVGFLDYKDDAGAPQRRPGDNEGPLVLAMASELPAREGAREGHGPRMVVVGSASVTQGQVWQVPALRGGAVFVENTISWLTSRPQIVDVPQKPAVMAGLRLTEESMKQVASYVTLYIPAAVSLVGAAVYLRRRSTERRRGDARSGPQAEK